MRVCSLVLTCLLTAVSVANAQSVARVEIVVASPSGEPLPFSEISVTPGQSRFTDEQGRMGFDAKAGVTYKIRLRHLGYTALDTAVVVTGAGRIHMRLSPVRVAFNLSVVDVREHNDCRTSGRSPQLPVLLEELRKNAQRDSLLRYQYPFAYRLSRTYDTFDPQMRMTSKFRDYSWYPGVPPDRYVPGSVDFRGSAYLDTASYMIRRIDFELTNYSEYAVSVSFTEMYRGLAIFDRIRSQQRMTGAAFSFTGENIVDDQKLVEVSFYRDAPAKQ